MISVSHPTKSLKGTIYLPSSKSISNRLLLLKKLYETDLQLDNLSNAKDTQLLKALLTLNKNELDVEDAGTAFRFLVAYCAATPGKWIIKGTNRLHQRPISELVNVLRVLGADIRYTENEEFAPLEIVGKQLESKQNTIDFSEVRSSQFVSALLMIAPKIKGDFSIKVNTEMNSYSYVMLTINAMRRLGFRIHMNEGLISISKEKKFDSEYFLVEPDWTSFYYWYAMAHLADEADLFFPGLHQNNMSKEKNCLFYIGNTALQFTDTIEGMRMQKIRKQGVTEFKSKYYFKQYPDIATTFALLLPALGCKQTSFVGLESLKFKECDREKAIGEQLAKMNVNFTKESNGWELASTDFRLEENTCFNTYGDHRMAMSAAPLALVKPITIEDETVVTKSYPHFWADLKSVGFKIQNL